MDPLIVLFGLGVGILVGLTGIGGGSLMTPLLLLVGGYSPVVAIGTDLAYGAVTKTVGGWRHLRAGHVDLRLSWWLAAGSGARLDPRRGRAQPAARHLRRGLRPVPARVRRGGADRGRRGDAVPLDVPPDMHRRERESAGLKRRRSKAATVVIGLVLGIVLGMTSVGSGALVGLVLILLYRLRPHRVVGTDVFHAAVMLWSAGLAHLAYGNVDLALMATILVGSLPGVWIGTALLPVRAGRRAAPHARDRAHRGGARRALEGRRADVAVRARRHPAGARGRLGDRAPAADARRPMSPRPQPSLNEA